MRRLLVACGALSLTGIAIGALFIPRLPDCHETICWAGLSPALLPLAAGALATSIRSLVVGVLVGALAGLSLSLGAGIAALIDPRLYCCGPKTIMSPVVLSVALGSLFGMGGGLIATSLLSLRRRAASKVR